MTIPVAVCLLVALRRDHDRATCGGTATSTRRRPARGAWKLRTALLVLGAATVATALVAELLVHSLDAFGTSLGLSQFFVSVVIVAIVGNAAEHGGAIVVAQRGNMRLAAEIAVSSSTQVAVFVTPVVALLSFVAGPGLPLAFRPIELATMAIATVAVAAVSLTRERRDGARLRADRPLPGRSPGGSSSPATARWARTAGTWRPSARGTSSSARSTSSSPTSMCVTARRRPARPSR